MSQMIVSGNGSICKISRILEQVGAKRWMLVCGSSLYSLPIYEELCAIPIPSVTFRDFSPNPKYEDICKGVELFKSEGCDAIVAVGGGSPMDVAKCIKLYSVLDEGEVYFKQAFRESAVPLIAVPTTAGTGSEATRYAVFYYRGEKQSVAHKCILPDYAILEPRVLESLPLYQKKCTLLDALCQALESWWSTKSVEESRAYAKRAVEGIMANRVSYLNGDASALEPILLASTDAGRAINYTATTAPHAMSYKLTTTYGFPHGHSVALGFPKVWRAMLDHPEACIDPRGVSYVWGTFTDMAQALGCSSPEEAVAFFEAMLADMGIEAPVATDRPSELAALTAAVNPDKIKTTPVALDSEAIFGMYDRILR